MMLLKTQRDSLRSNIYIAESDGWREALQLYCVSLIFSFLPCILHDMRLVQDRNNFIAKSKLIF